MKHPETPARGAWRGRLLKGLTIVAAFGVAGLVTTFHRVVSGSVLQGESRRRAAAAHSESEWRCKAERERLVRTECLLRLNPPQRAVMSMASGSAPS